VAAKAQPVNEAGDRNAPNPEASIGQCAGLIDDEDDIDRY